MLHNVPLPRLYTPGDATTSLLEAGGHRYVLTGVGTAVGDGDEPKGEGAGTSPKVTGREETRSEVWHPATGTSPKVRGRGGR